MLPPLNFTKWIQENKDKLSPPVNNFCLWKEEDFTVMALGGPNARTDYHINSTEEFFYQIKGDMLLKTVQDGKFIDIPIKEGEMFLLPGNIPHNPCRFQDTVGLVIEVKRPANSLDTLRWYCQECHQVLYQESFYCVDLGTQLAPVIRKFAEQEALRTCQHCGTLNSAKPIE